MSLGEFPDEILLAIFSHLSIDSLHQNVALVCQRFHRLSEVPIALKRLRLHIDKNGRANFNAKLLALHSRTRVLDIQADCCVNNKVMDSFGRIWWVPDMMPGHDDKAPSEAHKVFMECLHNFKSLQSIRIHGQCRYLTEARSHLDQNGLARIKAVDCDFFGGWQFILRCMGLREVRYFGQISSLMVFNHVMQTSAHTLVSLTVPGLEQDGGVGALVSQPSWNLLPYCTRLRYVHLPFSREYWLAISSLASVKTIGMTFNVNNQIDTMHSLPMLLSESVEELILEGPNETVLKITTFWQALPKVQRLTISFFANAKTSLLGDWWQRICETFPDLVELSWEPLPECPKNACSSYDGLVDYFLQLNKRKTAEAASNVGLSLIKLRKISIPYDCEDPIYKYCPNVTELSFTWNKNITVEHLYNGMMPDVLKFYRGQIEQIRLEENERFKFAIPDMIMWRIKDHCRYANVEACEK